MNLCRFAGTWDQSWLRKNTLLIINQEDYTNEKNSIIFIGCNDVLYNRSIGAIAGESGGLCGYAGTHSDEEK